MTQAHFFAQTSLRQRLLCVLALITLGSASAVHATTTDPLAISGTPPSKVVVGQKYSFTPTVSNPNKKSLKFAIDNMPTWMSFNTATGQLTGTPTAANVGWSGTMQIGVTDWVVWRDIPGFSITVTAASGGTDTPTISGTPKTSVVAGSAYSFQPTAKDPDGKTLSFSVQNKPDWATFSISTGLLSGTPSTSQTGTYGDSIISASNGSASAALPGFNVAVTSSTPTSASATIDWVPPTKNTNGSALTDLAGVRIYYGTSASSLTQVMQVASSTQTSATISNLTAGTWYFGGVAYTTTGAESTMSKVVSVAVQ
jgi:Putative Ig domain